MSGLTLAQVYGFCGTVTFSGTSGGLSGSAKLLLYRKATTSRSAILPPGPPGNLQNKGELSIVCSNCVVTFVIQWTVTHQQRQMTNGSDAPDNQRILCRAPLTDDEMIEDILARSWNIDVVSVLRAG